METTLCPHCRRSSVSVTARSDGAEESRCTTCGWTGPMCFGQKHDPNNVKCTGGQDPTYWSGADHLRRRCSYYNQCQEAMAVQARQNVEVKLPMYGGLPTMPNNSVAQKHPVLPPMPSMGALTQQQPQRTQQPQMQAPLQQVSLQQALAQRAPQQQQQVLPRPQAMPQPQQAMPQQAYGGYYAGQQQQVPVYLVQPQYAPMPAVVPQNHVQPGMQVPAYLTVPEPYNGHFAPMFINSVMRAGLKGMFHTAANLMDHFPWGEYGPPPGT